MFKMIAKTETRNGTRTEKFFGTAKDMENARAQVRAQAPQGSTVDIKVTQHKK